MRKGTGKLDKASKSNSGILYLPSQVMLDSAFPFYVPSRVKVRIDGDKLIIESLDER
jgi:hypothetical protein